MEAYKVKAKHKQGGMWLTGVPMKIENKYMLLLEDSENLLRVHYTEGEMWNAAVYAVEIDESTICRPTGMTDKNGNKIWENDVVKYHFGDSVATIKFGEYQSCFDSEKACHVGFFVDWKEGYLRKDLGYWVKMIDCNIVGNIFDNPELLEGGE